MFHFLRSPTHVFCFSGLLLCHFALGRVLGIVDAQHCRCRWFTLSAITIDAQHCKCMWFTLSAGIVDARHCRRRVVDTTSSHCSSQRPWTPQHSHQIRSSVCWWAVKEVFLRLYKLVLFQNIQDFKITQVGCGQVHNFSFFWIYAKRNSGSAIGSLSDKQIGKILQSSWITFLGSASELEASAWQVEQDEGYLWDQEEETQVTGASPSDWPWFEKFVQMFGGPAKINGIPNAID
jgi:hypothetical protein